MNELSILNEEELQINESQSRVWIRVQDAVLLLWKENPKLHDLGSVITAIDTYGFRIVPNFDASLLNVADEAGAIADGNGRVRSLAKMENDEDYELPRGLALDSDDAWCMPVNVGLDAVSQTQAEAFALDANMLTLAGANMDFFDTARLWDEEWYKKLLVKLGKAEELPISVDGDSLDLWLKDGLNDKGLVEKKAQSEKNPPLYCPNC